MWLMKINKCWVACDEQAAAFALADGVAVKFVGGVR